jgi:ornithine--oxo-acid transaminase
MSAEAQEPMKPTERAMAKVQKAMSSADHLALMDARCAKNYAPLPVVISRGKGAVVWDVEGKRYLDLLSAYSALNQGHCHPRIVAAMHDQVDMLTLTSRAFHNDRLAPFLDKLCALAGYEQALPMNSGAEAVETALKLMRRWGYDRKKVAEGKARIVVASGNFHGRTIATVGLSDDPSSFAGYGPFPPCFDRVPYADIEAFRRALGPETVGVLLEPIQGEAGVIIPPDEYLRQVRAACTEKGILLAFDEVQTGLGRTGKMFAWQHSGARPDLLVLGKALSGGLLPLSAVCASREIMSVFTPGTHGSTFGGNPLACAVGIAALDVLVDEVLPARAARLGEKALGVLRQKLSPGKGNVKEVRGRGLLMAVEFVRPVAHEAVVRLCQKSVLAKDTHETTVRLAPPLVIAEAELDEALATVCEVFRGL